MPTEVPVASRPRSRAPSCLAATSEIVRTVCRSDTPRDPHFQGFHPRLIIGPTLAWVKSCFVSSGRPKLILSKPMGPKAGSG
jgi:hypothetical protein